MRRSILEQALTATTQDRNTSYGEAEDNFAVIAHLTSVYDAAVAAYRKDKCPAIDIAIHNILQKIARIVTSPFRQDHYVDIAGYAACGGGIAADEQERREPTPEGVAAVIREKFPDLEVDVPAGTNARLDAQRQNGPSLD